ncbi:MAG: 16S rRNA (uracil(1498)-N(3))-methyltransferase [Robiginitomaculum sp.]|nr:16S rRNA (uracil(1498)-N(3))-methyltransferase [Robiginitomaculum sp.]
MRDFYKLPRLYIPDDLAAGTDIELAGQQSHYLARVMRRRVGDKLRLFNGRDGEYLAQLAAINKRSVGLSIIENIRTQTTAPDIWLLFAPIKKHRNTFIVEKATELGASFIRPIITARTTSRIKVEKIDAHIIEAAEQTERLDLPQIGEAIKLDMLLNDWDETRTLIFADEAGAGENSGEPAVTILAKIKAPAAILIGPEGGFTDAEREALHAKSYCTPISLGPRILRADTAAAATLALWQAVSGDW